MWPFMYTWQMIRAARKDSNHNEIANYFLNHGASVGDLSQVKRLCDLVVGFRGINELVEVKDGSKPPSQQKLTPGEQQFHDRHRGTISVITNLEEAKQLLLAMDQKSIALISAGINLTR